MMWQVLIYQLGLVSHYLNTLWEGEGEKSKEGKGGKDFFLLSNDIYNMNLQQSVARFKE